MKQKQQGIYTITNAVTGEQYVGSSIDVSGRLIRHRYHLNTGKHPTKAMQAAWNRDGAAAFTYTLIEAVASESDLASREQFYIDTLKPTYNGNHKAKRDPRKHTWTDEQDHARFWSHVEKRQGGCWIWNNAARHSANGDPLILFRAGGRRIAVRRFAYQSFVRALDSNDLLRRVCPSPLCVNPDHMSIIARRGPGRKRNEFCWKGHALTPDNTYTYVNKSGITVRRCRTCQRAVDRENAQRKRSKP